MLLAMYVCMYLYIIIVLPPESDLEKLLEINSSESIVIVS